MKRPVWTEQNNEAGRKSRTGRKKTRSGPRRTLRKELSLSIIGLALLSALVYTGLLDFYYQRGFVETSHVTLRMEVREFVQRYAEDPETEPPSTRILHFFLDDWDAIPEFYRSKFSKTTLEAGEVQDVDWFPNGMFEWDGYHYMVARSVKLEDGRRLYAIVDYDADLMTESEQADFDRFFVRVLLVGGIFILLMTLMVVLFGRRMNRQTQQLADWADQLTLENMHEGRPDFRYQEFNRISDRLSGAFQRISALLEREHRFLRNASHELRTPIAVIRANMELLNKMGFEPRQERPAERIDRASQSMLHITETLLWISRETADQPRVAEVNIQAMLLEMTEDLSYLLKDKPVTLALNSSAEAGLSKNDVVNLAVTPFRIVLTNLIRNAFQHTQEGDVQVQCLAGRVIINNTDNGLAHGNRDDSFGLGLMLSQQICERMGWRLQLDIRDNGVCAELHYLSDNETKVS